uniref:PAS domain-containing sensor histidine kinase n=1 Tax=Paraburkholderia ferrariae TaxID=386056 RepID=UPI0007C6FAC9
MSPDADPHRSAARDAAPVRAGLAGRPAVAAALAFIVAFALAGLAAAFVVQQWQAAAEQRFARRTSALRVTAGQALIADEAMLRGARGWLAQTPAPDPAGWQRYVLALDLESSRSAVVALGYVAPRAEPDKGASAPTGDAILWSGLAAAPPDVVAHTAADQAQALAARRYAAQTGSVALAVETIPGNAAPLLTLYLPLYAQPAAAGAATRPVSGFAVALLDPRRLFEPILATQPDLGLTVSAGQPGVELYRSAPAETDEVMPGSRVERTDTLAFGGTTLTLKTSAAANPLLTGAFTCAAAILLAGALVAALCAALAFRLARPRAVPAPTPAEGDARLNEARMMGIIRSSMEAIITVDETQRVVIFNPAAEFVFGLSAMEAIGSPLARFIPERFRAAHERHVDQFGATGVTERQMGHQQRVLYGVRASGEEFPIEASISQIRDRSGKLYTVMLRDITERLRAENSLRRSREELRELSANLQNVREAEKTRIARELHDDLGQQLTALKIDLSTLEQRLKGNLTPDLAARIEGMSTLIDSTVRAVRRIAADLRPVMLDDLGLVPAIEWLANDFTSRYGIAVQRHIHTGNTTFSNAAASTLFRIVQEALTNVARHSEASVVVLTLEVEGQRCTLRIVDNGRGTERDAGGSPHRTRHDKSFGLLGIRERAHMLNGTVDIDTAPGEGFAICLTFELD